MKTTGAGHAGAGLSRQGADGVNHGASGRDEKPPSKSLVRREYPDLVTLEPADDDEEVFGDTRPLIVQWRALTLRRWSRL